MNNSYGRVLGGESTPWVAFQPQRALMLGKPATRTGQPPCPGLEETLFQLFAQEFFSAKELQTSGHRSPAAQVKGSDPDITESASDYELSERVARRLQEQEDEEAAERVQLSEFMSVAAGLSNILAPSTFTPHPQGEVMPPATVKRPSKSSSSSSSSSSSEPGKSCRARSSVKEGCQANVSDKKSGKQRARTPAISATRLSPAEQLDKIERALKREVKKFNFPERLDFCHGEVPAREGHLSPELSHTLNNLEINAFEKELVGFRDRLHSLRDCQDRSVIERRSQLDAKIKRKLSDLDKRVLEAWASERRVSPS